MYRLGRWQFDPGAHELRSDVEVIRLEHRASAVLALLCERRGETVSQGEMLDRVWAGRHVSANSVPVVIGNLRRALGDTARDARYVQTVAKSGYRLIAQAAGEGVPPSRSRGSLWVLAALVLLALGIGAYSLRPPAPAKLVVEEARNETGDPRYDSLGRAVRATMIGQLDARHVEIADGDAQNSQGLRMRIKVLLWNGRPEIAMEVLDPVTGKLRWTGSAFVPEARLPMAIAGLAQDFTRKSAAF